MIKSRVIAIDGPAASGKSTVASELSRRLGIAYVSTGSLYRAVAFAALKSGENLAELSPEFLHTLKIEYCLDAQGVFVLKLNGAELGAELRTAEVSSGASLVATQKAVRNFLLELQRGFAGERLIVMEGRDIGTVIFPDAQFKYFITATPEERARRRLAQGGEVSDSAGLAAVAREIALRDKQDSERATAPLKRADDAELIDTTGLTITEVVERIVAAVRAKGY